MAKFKVGDRVKQIKSIVSDEDPRATITKIQHMNSGEIRYEHRHDCGKIGICTEEGFIPLSNDLALEEAITSAIAELKKNR